MFSSSTRSSVRSAIVEKLRTSPTAMTISATTTSRIVCTSRAAFRAVSVGAKRRDRNCSSTAPRRTRSPGLILTGMDRSSRFPFSRVPFVLWSVSQAWSRSRSSRTSRCVRETAGSSTISR